MSSSIIILNARLILTSTPPNPPDRYSYPAICKVNVTVKTAVDGSYLSYRESKVCSQVNPGIIESMDPCGKGK